MNLDWKTLPKNIPVLYKDYNTTDSIVSLFEIVSKETPFYRINSDGGYTEKERNIIKDWFMSIIEGKDYSVDVSSMFDCFMDRIMIRRNLKLLQQYKNKIYSKLKEHQTLDREVSILASKSEANLEKLNNF